ncbi:FHA domain-containing protein [Roseovarius azorensis]|uniref:FHA domain-containing protein n=1 Tax=Roseovarius azorensis TaxID=1287727 RepID=A0A1H7U0D8_9RHOB|nr:FHA domain-containing protein [Roseovarius azorensis]SEL90264.1 FHA domain-containing protein [Roseovarius azorensis]
MRFIREIISEKRSAPVAETADLAKPDTGESRYEPLRAGAQMYPPGRASDPLPLDAYELPQDDSFEDAEFDSDFSLFDQSGEEIGDSAPDQVEDAQPDLRQPMNTDDLAFDDAQEEEDYFKDLDISDLNDLQGIADPFEKLRQEHFEQRAEYQAPDPLETCEPEELPAMDARMPIAEPLPERPVEETSSVEVPAPAAGRGSSRSGRVKTRLLGFSAGSLDQTDMFEKTTSHSDSPFPVGWLVVVSELGRGASFALHDGVSKVGRGTDQTVCLNFGDNSISRDNHLSIAYDSEQNRFFVGHSGKSNLVRLNNKPLLSTEELCSRDQIRLGETTLRFIALCEDDFTWAKSEQEALKRA